MLWLARLASGFCCATQVLMWADVVLPSGRGEALAGASAAPDVGGGITRPQEVAADLLVPVWILALVEAKRQVAGTQRQAFAVQFARPRIALARAIERALDGDLA